MIDTTGKEIGAFYSPCPARCGNTAGCDKCNPSFMKKVECNHRWELCSDVVEHCLDCGIHKKLLGK